MSSANSSNRNNYSRPNIWGMIRDIGVASLNKGQFPLAIVGGIVIVLLIKMPSNTVPDFLQAVVDGFKTLHLVGWALVPLLTGGWFWNAKRLRKKYSDEMERVSGEKKKLQQKLSRKKLSSSNGE